MAGFERIINTPYVFPNTNEDLYLAPSFSRGWVGEGAGSAQGSPLPFTHSSQVKPRYWIPALRKAQPWDVVWETRTLIQHHSCPQRNLVCDKTENLLTRQKCNYKSRVLEDEASNSQVQQMLPAIPPPLPGYIRTSVSYHTYSSPLGPWPSNDIFSKLIIAEISIYNLIHSYDKLLFSVYHT